MALVTKLFQKLNKYTNHPDVSTYNLYENDYVNCMKSFNNIVYIGGSFTKVINNLSSIIVNNIFIYNSLNNRITQMQGGVNDEVNQICVDSSGNAYIVGNFTKVYDSSYNEIYDNCGNSIKYLVKWDYSNNQFDYVLINGFFNNFIGNLQACDIYNNNYLYLGTSSFNNITPDNLTRYVYTDINLYPNNSTLGNLLLIYLKSDKTKTKIINLGTLTNSITKLKAFSNNYIYASSSDPSGSFEYLHLTVSSTMSINVYGNLSYYLTNTLDMTSNNNITCKTVTDFDFSNNLISKNIDLTSISNLYKLNTINYDVSGTIDISGAPIYSGKDIIGYYLIDMSGNLNTTAQFNFINNISNLNNNFEFNFNTDISLDLSGNLYIDPSGSGGPNQNQNFLHYGPSDNDGLLSFTVSGTNIIGPINFYGNLLFDSSGSLITKGQTDVNKIYLYPNITLTMNVLTPSITTIYSTNPVYSFYVDPSRNTFYGGNNIFRYNSTAKTITPTTNYNDYIIHDIIYDSNFYSYRVLYLIGYFKSSVSVNYPYLSIIIYLIDYNLYTLLLPQKAIFNNRYGISTYMKCGTLAPSIFNYTDLLAGGVYLSYYDFKQYYSMIDYLKLNNLIMYNASLDLIKNLINNNITHDTFSTQIGYIFKNYISSIK
jgi:hypothetical protein